MLSTNEMFTIFGNPDEDWRFESEFRYILPCHCVCLTTIGVFTLGATSCNSALQLVCNWTLSCNSQLQPVATGELRVGPHEVLQTRNTHNSPKPQLDPVHPRALIPPNSDARVSRLLVDSYHVQS